MAVSFLHNPVRGVALMACAGLLLSGCSYLRDLNRNARPTFDGQYFRVAVAAVKTEPESFVVTVRDAGKSLVGAREAGRYEASSHCIEYFGSSRIDWTNGPEAPDQALVLRDGDLVMDGTCRGW